MTDFEAVNWLEEVTKRQDELLADLFHLLRIDSVRNDEKADADNPVGPGPRKAMEEFLKLAERDGFQTEQFGPWAGRVEIGEGDELFGILGHMDVVPVGTGWDTDPFEPEIIDGKIFARGSSDDKGPTVAAYFALKLLRDMGATFNKRIHLIVGTDEESGWQCMDYYFDHAEMPDFGFSPDATFPIINGEKGNVSAELTVQAGTQQEGDLALEHFAAGLRPNMVPQDAQAELTIEAAGFDGGAFLRAYNTYLDNHDLQGEASIQDGTISMDLVGKSAHGSTPEKGVNAGTHLARFLAEFTYTANGADEFLRFLGEIVHGNFDGASLGVDHEDAVMGEVSMNVGIMEFAPAKGGHIDINFRYPKGTNPDQMLEHIQDRLLQFSQIEVTMGEFKKPHYVPADDPLVATLLEVYHKQTGLEPHEQVIGGGTYARLMPRGVAYGALFPDSTDTMHQANEFLALDDLLRATAIYAEAIYRLSR